MMGIKKYMLLLFLFALGATATAFAQLDSVAKAAWLLLDTSISEKTRTKRALELVDKSISHADAINSSYAWYVRGIVYKEWYKAFEKQNKKSRARLDAVDFLKKALSLDTSKGRNIPIKNNVEYNGQTHILTDIYSSSDIKANLRFIAASFNNDAALLVDSVNYNAAIFNFEKFKECILIAQPNYNIRPMEINFKIVLADQYAKIFKNNIKENSAFFGMAEANYKQAIALDTNLWNGNYNLAMLYYNYGVDIITDMSVEISLIDVESIQDEAKDKFKKALPYALKAYSLNPKRIEVLKCLEGINVSLYEFDKADEYKAQRELLEKGK